jgi:cytochrome c biogenesis protein CcmG/thiol:disulfide interchange protein DsbE
MFSSRKLIIWTICFLGCFSLNFGCEKDVGAGPVAPDFSLPDLSGKLCTLSAYKGNVVVLDFWATWCPPCRMSLPEMVELQKKFKDKGLVILGVSLDDPRQANDKYLLAFKEKFGINYTILRYDGKVIRDYFGFKSPVIPTIFVIDREGKIRNKHEGYRPGAVEKSLQGVFE